MAGTEHRQRLAAILAADAAGYSRLMATDEQATVVALDAARAVFRTRIEANRGRIIDMAGDSVLAVFETATGAVSAALTIQDLLRALIADVPEDRRMRFRIGLHLGDVIEKSDGTVYGDGVNIASRLEGLAEPGGITVSESIRTAVKGKVVATFEDQGEQTVKNIADPVRAYRVKSGAQASSIPKAGAAEIDLSLPDKPSIAVLPFVNMSGDPEQEYFTDGITEDIITELSRFKSLFVIARNSSFTYKGKPVDVRTVAKELGVRYVLEGSIRKAGSRIRVTSQLIDALTGSHLWAEKYDRVLEDIFEVQEEVTRSIVAAIGPQVELAERAKLRHQRAGSAGAYENAVRARTTVAEGFRSADSGLCERALGLAREVLTVDPDNRVALGVVAYAQQQLIALGAASDPAAAWHEAMEANSRAIAAEPLWAQSYAFRGTLLMWAIGGGQWDEAMRNMRHAYALNPNDTVVLSTLGWGETLAGDPRVGIDCAERCLRISPRDPWAFSILNGKSMAQFVVGDYEGCVDTAKAASSAAPRMIQSHLMIAMGEVGLGNLAAARTAFGHANEVNPDYVKKRLDGTLEVPFRDKRIVRRQSVFLRIAAGLEEMSAAETVR